MLLVRVRFSWMGPIALVALAGCLQTPRSRLLDTPPRDRASWRGSSAQTQKMVVPPSRQFTDTSVVEINGQQRTSLETLLASAKLHVDEQKFPVAEDEIRMLLETGEERDSVTDEARFLLGEMFVMQNKLPDARRQFAAVLKNVGLTVSVREKCLLRLGHVFCAEGNVDDAVKVFKQFRREFPGSSYVALADCSAVGR